MSLDNLTLGKRINRSLRLPFNRYGAFRQLAKFHSTERTLEDIVAWGMKFPSSGYFRTNSIQIKSEILALVNEVSNLHPDIIVEIGTARGGTLFMWSQLAKSKVITCDLIENDIKKPFYESFPKPASSCEVVLLSGDSHDIKFKERLRKELDGKHIDFLFIDGDHTERGVEADFNMYKDLVRPGGAIAFHDIVQKQPIPENQVFYFWDRIKNNYKHKEFINDNDQCGYGIGILWV